MLRQNADKARACTKTPFCASAPPLSQGRKAGLTAHVTNGGKLAHKAKACLGLAALYCLQACCMCYCLLKGPLVLLSYLFLLFRGEVILQASTRNKKGELHGLNVDRSDYLLRHKNTHSICMCFTPTTMLKVFLISSGVLPATNSGSGKWL